MIGSVVFSTESGLGILAKSFYDAGVIEKVLVVKHSRHKGHDWFSNSKPYSEENYEWFLDGLDSVLFFETPFDWRLIPMAKKHGITTMIMPDECTPYPLKYEPDYIVCPSLLEATYNRSRECINITVPPDVTWRERTKASVFIHNAGNGGLGGRNGTQELLDSMQYVTSPIKLIVRSQTNAYRSDDPRVEIRMGSIPHNELWNEGDVFVFPDKFAGLSLPMQEAFAAGMLVMGTDRFPTNHWLPEDPLIPVSGYKDERLGIPFKSAVIDPRDIASTIDYWYNKDITAFSHVGREWAQQNTWQKVKNELSLVG